MAELTDTTDIREIVRERYANAAKAVATGAYDKPGARVRPRRAALRSRWLRPRL